MKVLIITPSYKPAYIYGGPMRSVTELCECLARNDVHVDVLTTTANGSEELPVIPGNLYRMDGVSVVYFRRWTGDHTHFSPALLRATWQRCRTYDRVHIQSWWNLVSVLSAILCIYRGVHPIVSLRGTLSRHSFTHRHAFMKQWMHRTIGKWVLKRSTLHVTSAKEEEEIRRLLPGAEIRLLYNMLALPAQHIRRREHTCFQCLFVGRIDPIKNLELVLQAFASVHTEIPWRLKIIGTGDADYIAKLKRLVDVQSPIEWVGEVDGMIKYQHMADADLLILLSHSENFGNVVIEALSQGTAVLVSKGVGLSEYVRKNQFGWVVQPGLTECIAGIESAYYDATLRESIRHRAPTCIREDFDQQRIVKKYLDMYLEEYSSTRQSRRSEVASVR